MTGQGAISVAGRHNAVICCTTLRVRMKRSQSIAKYSVVFILYESVPKQLQALFFFNYDDMIFELAMIANNRRQQLWVWDAVI